MINENRHGINAAVTINGETIVYPMHVRTGNDMMKWSDLNADYRKMTERKLAKPACRQPKGVSKNNVYAHNIVANCWLGKEDVLFDVAARLALIFGYNSEYAYLRTCNRSLLSAKDYTRFVQCYGLKNDMACMATGDLIDYSAQNRIELIFCSEEFNHKVLVYASDDAADVAACYDRLKRMILVNFENPAVIFTNTAKTGVLNSLSDEAYTAMLDTVKNLSNMFWTDRKFVSFIDMIVEISAFILADATQNGYAELAELIKADAVYRDCLALAIKNAQTEADSVEDDEIPLWDDEPDVVVVQCDNKGSSKKGKKKKGKKKKSKDESEISDEDLSAYFDDDDE